MTSASLAFCVRKDGLARWALRKWGRLRRTAASPRKGESGAEAKHSEDMLISVNFELGDVALVFRDILYHFIGSPVSMAESEVRTRRQVGGIDGNYLDEAVELLIWFGFLGVRGPAPDPQFAYQVHYNLNQAPRGASGPAVAR